MDYNKKVLNNLEDIWKDQLDFTNKILPCTPEEMTPEQRQFWTEKYILLLNREVMEVLAETEFKPHRAIKGNVTRSNITEELVDVFKYFMCLCQVQKVTPEELMEEYHRKTNVVKQRYHQEKVLKYDGKIVGVDIDGVLADYPRSFVEYVNEKLGSSFDYKEVKKYNIADELGLSTEACINLKHEYRDEGAKRFIPVVEGAKQFLDDLKCMGYTVILLTARPIEKYKRIFADTQYWLNANKLQYDAILFDEYKGERLVKEFGKENISFFIDDVTGNANGVSNAGFKCYLLNKSYNEGDKLERLVKRVDSLKEIILEIRGE